MERWGVSGEQKKTNCNDISTSFRQLIHWTQFHWIEFESAHNISVLLGFSICNKFAWKLNYIEIIIGREPEIENNEKSPKQNSTKMWIANFGWLFCISRLFVGSIINIGSNLCFACLYWFCVAALYKAFNIFSIINKWSLYLSYIYNWLSHRFLFSCL